MHAIGIAYVTTHEPLVHIGQVRKRLGGRGALVDIWMVLFGELSIARLDRRGVGRGGQ